MKAYFATSSGNQHIDMLLDEKDVDSILLSYAYCRKGIPDAVIKRGARGLNVMLDSGGFTNIKKPGLIKIEEYMEFLDAHKKYVDEYVQLDNPKFRPTTLKNYHHMIEKGYKPLYVDHVWFKWIEDLKAIYKNKKLCWGGVSIFMEPRVIKRLKERYGHASGDPRSKLHLLGVGQRIRRFLPWFDLVDSFDAATWCRAPGQYGKWCLYYPPSKEKPFPVFRQLSPESYSGVRPPKEVFEQASRYGLNLHKYEDRIRMAIRELSRYYRALDIFYNQEKKKGFDHLMEISVRKDDPIPDNARQSVIQVMWQRESPVPDSRTGDADQSKREDVVVPGRFFWQPKPTRAASAEEEQTVERLVSLFTERADKWMPTFVQKKYDGARHQVHKVGDKVTIFSEDGVDNTDRLPSVVEEVRALKPDKLVFDSEIEMWDKRQHLPREVTAGYLHSKDTPDDSGIVVNGFDVLYSGEDIHKEPTWTRLKALIDLKMKQSTMGIPDQSKKLNAVPGIKVKSVAELERAVRKIRQLPGSEGIVAKQADAGYPLALVTEDTWVKYHNATLIRGLVHDRTAVAKSPGTWTLHYGVLPGKKEATKTVKVDGRVLVPVGDTFNTSRDIKAGDGVLVEAETINVEESPAGVKITAWVPRVIGPWDGEPDTVDSAAARARKNLVLQEKKVGEGGEVEYVPTSKVEKQADPYMEIPSEDREYRYTAHHHHRGKSLHTDLRIGFRPGKLLIGWTLNTQIKEAIKEPVTALAQARALARDRMASISKINWNTGEWAERPKKGTPKLVRTTILTERKAPEPWAWMDVEGKTKEPGEGKPPPVGGTRNFPGVFHIVDRGTVEFGAQKPWFHEYFLHGPATGYRLIFRSLKLGEVEKAVLPPSEEQDRPMDTRQWFAIRPDDLTPYVLDKNAVDKKWMPPVGVSALPAAVRSQVPKEHRYWDAKSATKARAIRDGLHAAIKAGDVKLDYAGTYKQKAEKASLLDAEFVLQEQTWRGPVQVRVGPSRTRWWVRLDVGRPQLVTFEFTRNPVDNPKTTALIGTDPHKDSLEFSGAIKPGHYLNPTKETPSNIEILDKGKASVINLTPDFVKVEFRGKKLKGLRQLKRNPDADEFLFSPSPAAPDTEEKQKAESYVPILKTEDEKRLVTGIVLEPNTIDAQNDTIKPDTIERTAHNFLAKYNKETEMGLLHRMFGQIGVELVESWIAHEDTTIGGEKVTKGSWLMTVHVTDNGVWRKIKDGTITGFSIGGLATVIPVAA